MNACEVISIHPFSTLYSLSIPAFHSRDPSSLIYTIKKISTDMLNV